MPQTNDIGQVIDDNGDVLLAGYVPTLWASIVSLIAFAILTAIYVTHWKRHGRQRYMLWMIVGTSAMVAGFAGRIVLTFYPTNLEALGPYLVQQILILLAPCAFIGQTYALLPRLATSTKTEHCLIFSPKMAFWIFITSDFVTLNLQSLGAGLAGGARDSKLQRDVGFYITLSGIVAQLISFIFFCFVVGIYGIRLRKRSDPFRDSPIRGGMKLYLSIVWNCFGLLLRTAFRTVEYAQGETGNLRIIEWYTYAFDVIPVCLAISVWCFIWPPVILESGHAHSELEMRGDDIEMSPELSDASASSAEMIGPGQGHRHLARGVPAGAVSIRRFMRC